MYEVSTKTRENSTFSTVPKQVWSLMLRSEGSLALPVRVPASVMLIVHMTFVVRLGMTTEIITL